MADDPLVIKIPEGATEINLRPILEPIIMALMRNIKTGPWAQDVREPIPSDVEKFVKRAFSNHAYLLLLPKLTRRIVKGFIEANGWKPETPGYDSVYVRYGDRIHLMANDETFDKSQTYADRAIHDIRNGMNEFFRKSDLYVLRRVLASQSVLDQMIVDDIEAET